MERQKRPRGDPIRHSESQKTPLLEWLGRVPEGRANCDTVGTRQRISESQRPPSIPRSLGDPAGGTLPISPLNNEQHS